LKNARSGGCAAPACLSPVMLQRAKWASPLLA
jgi:hypothetical protein